VWVWHMSVGVAHECGCVYIKYRCTQDLYCNTKPRKPFWR